MSICWLIDAAVVIGNMADRWKYVQFLHDASEINMSVPREGNKNDLSLTLPVLKPPVEFRFWRYF